ncbi:hypothetical protein [Klebsiella pneumoniae IS46]|nr:hypothetical protein [Klebsiella pneumoniae IS46]
MVTTNLLRRNKTWLKNTMRRNRPHRKGNYRGETVTWLPLPAMATR